MILQGDFKMRMKILLFTILVLLLLTALQTAGEEYEVKRNYETVEGNWTTLTYTPDVYLNYPGYFPLEISFNSLGELPKDLREYYNYSNTVFIGHFIITSSLDSFDSIDRKRDDDELIGLKPLELSFELSDIPKNISMITMEIRFIPHNESLGITSDVYDIEIQLLREADFNDLLDSLMRFVLPLFLLFAWFFTHKWINKKFLDNISLIKVPYYCIKYLNRKLKLFEGIILIIAIIAIVLFISVLDVKWL